MRRELGKPDPKTKRWSKRHHEIAAAVKALNGTVVTSRDLAEIGISQPSVARRYGAKVRNITPQEVGLEQQTRPYHLMNWQLPNADLEDAWQVLRQGSHSQIVQLRYERGIGKARWTRAAGSRPTDKAYWKALDAEAIKARKWFAAQEASA